MTASPGHPLHHAGGSVTELLPASRINVVNLSVYRFLKRSGCSQQSRALVNVIDALAELSKVSGEARNLVHRAEILLARIG